MTWDRGNTVSDSDHEPSFGEDLEFPEQEGQNM